MQVLNLSYFSIKCHFKIKEHSLSKLMGMSLLSGQE